MPGDEKEAADAPPAADASADVPSTAGTADETPAANEESPKEEPPNEEPAKDEPAKEESPKDEPTKEDQSEEPSKEAEELVSLSAPDPAPATDRTPDPVKEEEKDKTAAAADDSEMAAEEEKPVVKTETPTPVDGKSSPTSKQDSPKETTKSESSPTSETPKEEPKEEPTEEPEGEESKEDEPEEKKPQEEKPEDEKPKEEKLKEEEPKEEKPEEEKSGTETRSEETGDDQEEVKKEPSDVQEDMIKVEEQSENVNAAAAKDESMDTGTDDQDTSLPDPAAEESAASKDLPYSTRGRSGNDAGSGAESWERTAREGLEEIGRVKEHTAAPSLGVSFLESLGEEERRTRTRYLPDVEGFDALRKGEIKEDLALARSLVSPGGVTSLKKTKAKKSRSDEENMEVDTDDGASPSEDGSSDVARLGTATIELPTRDLVVPSNAFVAPRSSSDDGSEGQKPGKTKNCVQSPLEVEAVLAFNPPRPPESIGTKKKHRMLRWERRPEDVEADLNNYRKTVQRTRQEVHTAEAEYERLETIDAHLRRHFLGHLNLVNEEYLRLTEELGAIQEECVKAADLLTARTRSRGAGKGSYVMRDVLTVLKTRGAENKESMDVQPEHTIANPVQSAGIGGLTMRSFLDWDRETKINPAPPAKAWILPGDRVVTPVGEGEVVDLLPTEANLEQTTKTTGRNKGNGRSPKEKKKGKHDGTDKKTSDQATVEPPRVSVKLSFGMGQFPLDTVTPAENPSSMSDGKLAKRWKSMIDVAVSVGGCLDLEGMASSFERKGSVKGGPDDLDNEDNSQMEVEDYPEENKSDDGVRPARKSAIKSLPFGSSLLPTAAGRGNLIHKLSMSEIEKGMHEALFNGSGVLGEKTNSGVTSQFRKAEDDEDEYLRLQSSLLQFRTSLLRQKRIRILNERTNAVINERYIRAEELVAEMRADLKSLKHRLEEELTELGINEKEAEAILSNFYYNAGVPVDGGDASPLKRKRISLSIGDHDEHMGADESDAAGHEVDRESVDDDLSGDDLEAHKSSKKVRLSQ